MLNTTNIKFYRACKSMLNAPDLTKAQKITYFKSVANLVNQQAISFMKVNGCHHKALPALNQKASIAERFLTKAWLK